MIHSILLVERVSINIIALTAIRIVSYMQFQDNIKMDFRYIGWGDMDWILLAQDKD
jgi:hypothetical protein